VDVCEVITGVLVKIVGGGGQGVSIGCRFLVKKGLCIILLRCLKSIYEENSISQEPLSVQSSSSSLSSFSRSSSLASSSSATITAKLNSVYVNILSLLSTLSKYDTNLPLLARLHGSIQLTFTIIKNSYDRGDDKLMYLAFGMLKIYASKNENNSNTIQKKLELVGVIGNLIRINSLQPLQNESGNIGILIDILTIIVKSNVGAQEAIAKIGMKTILHHCGSTIPSIQKAALRVVIILNGYGFGKQEFEKCEGGKVLMDQLGVFLQGVGI
jgi:hypothetical protein